VRSGREKKAIGSTKLRKEIPGGKKNESNDYEHVQIAKPEDDRVGKLARFKET